MKKVLLSSFLLLVPCAVSYAQQNWDASPNNPKNSPYNYSNSPNNWKNSPGNPKNSTADFKNSPNNWANSPNNPNSYNVYDDKGKRVGWYARNSQGVLVYFNGEGKITPSPVLGGGNSKPTDASSPEAPDASANAPAASAPGGSANEAPAPPEK